MNPRIIPAAIFTSIGILLLLGIPKIGAGTLLGSLNLLAGILFFGVIYIRRKRIHK